MDKKQIKQNRETLISIQSQIEDLIDGFSAESKHIAYEVLEKLDDLIDALYIDTHTDLKHILRKAWRNDEDKLNSPEIEPIEPKIETEPVVETYPIDEETLPIDSDCNVIDTDEAESKSNFIDLSKDDLISKSTDPFGNDSITDILKSDDNNKKDEDLLESFNKLKLSDVINKLNESNKKKVRFIF